MMFYLNVFYLPVLIQVLAQYKMWNDVMFRFSQIIIYKQQKQYVLTTVKEIKYRKDSCISRTFLLKFWAKN